MRQLLRAIVFALTILFGIPAAALLVARLGFVALPPDTYLRPVTEISPDSSDVVDARVLEPPDAPDVLDVPDVPDAARTVIARVAVIEAAAHLPGHQQGVDRDWAFHRGSPRGSAPGATTDVRGSARVRCDGCGAQGEERLWVSARVVGLRADRAEVAVTWTRAPERRRTYRRPDGSSAVVVHDRGRIYVTLELAGGEWRALHIAPQQ